MELFNPIDEEDFPIDDNVGSCPDMSPHILEEFLTPHGLEEPGLAGFGPGVESNSVVENTLSGSRSEVQHVTASGHSNLSLGSVRHHKVDA